MTTQLPIIPPPRQAPLRPKLSINTEQPRILGKGASLRLETLSAVSPTVRNTFSNAYERPAPAPSTPNSAFLFSPIIFVTFIYEDNPYLLQHYSLPIPFYDRSPSLSVYYLISLLQMPAAMTVVTIGISQGVVPLVFALLMNNIIFKYCKIINNLSKIADEFLEQNTCTRENDTFTKFIRSFEEDLAALVLRYQELTK
jgi:hypothetical protein